MRKSKKLLQNIVNAITDGATITGICKNFEIDRRTFYRWKNEDPVFEEKIKEAIELKENLKNDLAENTLIQLMREGNWQATKYQLDKKEKIREESKSIFSHPVTYTVVELDPDKVRKEREEISRPKN